MAKYVTEEKFDLAMHDIHARFDDLKNEFVSKSEFGSFRNELMTTLDGMTTILMRLDQERVFTSEWIRRIESDVTRIKQQLKIA